MRNTGSAPLALAGIRITSPFQFEFPGSTPPLAAGARTLLVRNRQAFLSRHPGIPNISGEFSAPLPHDHGRITITGPLLEPILDFTYQDSWLALADGFGFSLVAADESATTADPGRAESWRLSAKTGGSPGILDPAAVRPLPVFVNEVMANTAPPQQDLIELHNANPVPVDISNWYLTDDFRNPRKFHIPAGVILTANGYLTLNSSQWQLGGVSDFALNARGEEVYLFSADSSGNLTGWVHGFHYGASPQAASFGRGLTAGGLEFFVIQSRPTPGTANAGPQVGPIVISEIMFQPRDAGISNNTLDEYIELRNISSEPVLLFSPAHPSSTWRIREDISYDFPENGIISADGFLVLVSFDPVEQPGRLAAFRARYGMSQEVPVFGPWTGQLNNTGGSIQLQRPDGGSVSGLADPPYIVADEIQFYPLPPWPTDAAGTGRSLLRRDNKAYGNDPANWISARPVPGDIDLDGDGLPDSWERLVGLNPAIGIGLDGADGDPDLDGLTNLQELQSGTLPRNPLSLLSLQAATVTPTQIFLSFRTQAGHGYTVMYRDGISTNASWQVLKSLVATGGNDTTVVSDVRTNSVRFYRLQSP